MMNAHCPATVDLTPQRCRGSGMEDLDVSEGPKWWQVWDELPSDGDRKRKREFDASPAQVGMRALILPATC